MRYLVCQVFYTKACVYHDSVCVYVCTLRIENKCIMFSFRHNYNDQYAIY
jgi:hypothetical protein